MFTYENCDCDLCWAVQQVVNEILLLICSVFNVLNAAINCPLDAPCLDIFSFA